MYAIRSYYEAELERKDIVFVFKNEGKGEYTFHTKGQPGERFALSADLIGDQGKWIKEKSELEAMLFNDEVIGVKSYNFV